MKKKLVTKPSIARWLTKVIRLSGIDTNNFKELAYRGAWLSKAFQRGASLEQIVVAGNWSNTGTSKSYYNSPSTDSDIGRITLNDL